MPLVDFTLTDVSSRMGVHVCDNLDIHLSTAIPQGSIPIGVKGYRSDLVGVGVEIVIADKRRNAAAYSGPMAQQEGTTLPATCTPEA